MYNMQWTTSCIDVLNEALLGRFLPFDFYRSTPCKQPVDKRLGWLLSDSANTSIGSDFSHNSDIRSVLHYKVLFSSMILKRQLLVVLSSFQNTLLRSVIWLCEMERCVQVFYTFMCGVHTMYV